MPRKPITPTIGKLTRSPRKVIGMLSGIVELARTQRIVEPQRDQSDEHERVARRGAERVQIAQHDDPGLAAEARL